LASHFALREVQFNFTISWLVQELDLLNFISQSGNAEKKDFDLLLMVLTLVFEWECEFLGE